MMKKSYRDLFSDVFIIFARPVISFLLSREIKVVSFGEEITKKDEPFILLSNHLNTWDAFAIMKRIKAKIRFVVTEIAYLDFSKKLSMKHLARTIKKRVGKADYEATKAIFTFLRSGYSIGIFPEADNTFYGETVDMYQSTGRLLKKANVNVVLVKQMGGYLSQPRWADNFAKKGVLHTHSKILFTKEQLQLLTATEITQIVEKEIYHNDYDWQRKNMIDMKRKNRAMGIERLVYYCNKCGSIMTVKGDKDDIYCSSCGKIGTFNKYDFIEGNKHDNLVDYNKEQYSHIEEVIASEFHFPVTLNSIDTKKLKNKKIGKYTLYYKDKIITLKNDKDTQKFELKKIKHQVNTMRHSFSFDYEGKTYNFTDIRHQFVLYEMCRYLNGSYKA